ncbi:MAG: hypothetical protein AB7F22_03960 [Reyranella sp.]|uniref:hypothetical protein n=1 Tax=Reyranella sp. TaxID=1929291 RepID=UPI003D09B033
MFLLAALAVGLAPDRAAAQEALDPGGLTFRDFAVNDNGASFNRGDPMIAGGPNQVSSRVLGVDAANGLARVQFASIRVDVSLPLGWQATEDWERGVAYSTDKRFRLIIWRVDFAFEGAKDAEHYAAMKSGSIQARRPTVQARARKLGDGVFLIVYQNVARAQGDSEGRTVFDLVLQKPGNPKEGILVTLGVPASQTDRGLRLLALLKQNLQITW